MQYYITIHVEGEEAESFAIFASTDQNLTMQVCDILNTHTDLDGELIKLLVPSEPTSAFVVERTEENLFHVLNYVCVTGIVNYTTLANQNDLLGRVGLTAGDLHLINCLEAIMPNGI